MRKFSTTTLAAAVAIALFTPAAGAQTGAGRANAGTNPTAPSNATNAGTTTSSNGVVTGNGSQGLGGGTINAIQANGTSMLGSTSQGSVVVIGTPIAGGNANGTNPTSSTTQRQTSFAASGNNATGTNAGQTSGTGTGSTSQGVTPSSIQNLQGMRMVDAQGRVLTDANGQPLTLDSSGGFGVSPLGVGTSGAGTATDSGGAGNGNAQVVILNPEALSGSVTSTPELDRATRKELDKAKAASRSRNKQLLYTIAPRTSVDRTDQMADDPPSPALSTPERSLPRF